MPDTPTTLDEAAARRAIAHIINSYRDQLSVALDTLRDDYLTRCDFSTCNDVDKACIDGALQVFEDQGTPGGTGMNTLLIVLGCVLGWTALLSGLLILEDWLHSRRSTTCDCITCLHWRAEAGDLDAEYELLIMQETT